MADLTATALLPPVLPPPVTESTSSLKRNSIITTNNVISSNALAAAAVRAAASNLVQHSQTNYDAAQQTRQCTDCSYFYTNGCIRGEDCYYRHSDYIRDNKIEDVCQNWSIHGKCRIDCKFRHPMISAGTKFPKQNGVNNSLGKRGSITKLPVGRVNARGNTKYTWKAGQVTERTVSGESLSEIKPKGQHYSSNIIKANITSPSKTVFKLDNKLLAQDKINLNQTTEISKNTVLDGEGGKILERSLFQISQFEAEKDKSKTIKPPVQPLDLDKLKQNFGLNNEKIINRNSKIKIDNTSIYNNKSIAPTIEQLTHEHLTNPLLSSNQKLAVLAQNIFPTATTNPNLLTKLSALPNPNSLPRPSQIFNNLAEPTVLPDKIDKTKFEKPKPKNQILDANSGENSNIQRQLSLAVLMVDASNRPAQTLHLEKPTKTIPQVHKELTLESPAPIKPTLQDVKVEQTDLSSLIKPATSPDLFDQEFVLKSKKLKKEKKLKKAKKTEKKAKKKKESKEDRAIKKHKKALKKLKKQTKNKLSEGEIFELTRKRTLDKISQIEGNEDKRRWQDSEDEEPDREFFDDRRKKDKRIRKISTDSDETRRRRDNREKGDWKKFNKFENIEYEDGEIPSDEYYESKTDYKQYKSKFKKEKYRYDDLKKSSKRESKHQGTDKYADDSNSPIKPAKRLRSEAQNVQITISNDGNDSSRNSNYSEDKRRHSSDRSDYNYKSNRDTYSKNKNLKINNKMIFSVQKDGYSSDSKSRASFENDCDHDSDKNSKSSGKRTNGERRHSSNEGMGIIYNWLKIKNENKIKTGMGGRKRSNSGEDDENENGEVKKQLTREEQEKRQRRQNKQIFPTKYDKHSDLKHKVDNKQDDTYENPKLSITTNSDSRQIYLQEDLKKEERPKKKFLIRRKQTKIDEPPSDSRNNSLSNSEYEEYKTESVDVKINPSYQSDTPSPNPKNQPVFTTAKPEQNQKIEKSNSADYYSQLSISMTSDIDESKDQTNTNDAVFTESRPVKFKIEDEKVKETVRFDESHKEGNKFKMELKRQSMSNTSTSSITDGLQLHADDDAIDAELDKLLYD